jgi:hypothetical protein
MPEHVNLASPVGDAADHRSFIDKTGDANAAAPDRAAYTKPHTDALAQANGNADADRAGHADADHRPYGDANSDHRSDSQPHPCGVRDACRRLRERLAGTGGRFG